MSVSVRKVLPISPYSLAKASRRSFRFCSLSSIFIRPKIRHKSNDQLWRHLPARGSADLPTEGTGPVAFRWPSPPLGGGNQRSWAGEDRKAQRAAYVMLHGRFRS